MKHVLCVLSWLVKAAFILLGVAIIGVILYSMAHTFGFFFLDWPEEAWTTIGAGFWVVLTIMGTISLGMWAWDYGC